MWRPCAAATMGDCEVYIECHSDDQHKGGALFVLWRVLFRLATNTNGLLQPNVEIHVSNRPHYFSASIDSSMYEEKDFAMIEMKF